MSAPYAKTQSCAGQNISLRLRVPAKKQGTLPAAESSQSWKRKTSDMVVFKLWEDNYLFGMSVLRTLFSKAEMTQTVPAHLTDLMLKQTLADAEKHNMPRTAAECRALLRLRPKQRRDAWRILRDPAR